VQLAVIAYPMFQERDHRWVETLRARCDPQASKIRAHFTLVFPVEIPESRLIEKRISTILSGRRSISLIIREARAMRDPHGPRHHVLLVPGKGRRELVALHDDLYEDPFRPYRCNEISFIPHVTVAECETSKSCGRLADELNRTTPPLRCLIRDIELIEVREKYVRRIARFGLNNDTDAPGPAPPSRQSSWWSWSRTRALPCSYQRNRSRR
jgi:2'-5' RNA ligase